MWIGAAVTFVYVLIALAGAAVHTRRSGQLRQRALQFERDYLIGDPNDAPLTMWVLGDSFAMGYGADDVYGSLPYIVGAGIAQQGCCVRVRNLSQSGTYLREVQGQQTTAHIAPEDLVLVLVGGMDTTHLTPLPVYKEQFAVLLDRLEGLACRQVLLSGSPDMSRGPAFPMPLKLLFACRCRQENALVRSELEGRSVTHVDLFKDGKLRRPHYSSDGDHPSAAGYAIWAEVFLRGFGASECPQEGSATG